MGTVTKLLARIGASGAPRKFTGRVAWTLHRLVRAGDRGVTPIEYPAPRWSDYVFKLRKAGVPVETIDEHHAGAYAGTHARYRLLVAVEILAIEEAA